MKLLRAASSPLSSSSLCIRALGNVGHAGALQQSVFFGGKCRRRRVSCGAAFTSLPVHFAKHLPIKLDAEVFLISVGASINLISAIGLVAWMQKSGYLPAETPVVLSQVAFRITIPCYLMTKVSTVLATQGTREMLLVPFIAVLQVFIGATLGKLLCVLLYGLPGGRKGERKIARKEALVTIACAFGNTLALPLVFLSGILPSKDVGLAAGYLALFMVGWSPALWSGAYAVLANVGGKTDTQGEGKPLRFWEFIDVSCRRVLNPPLCGVLIGTVIGLTPLSTILIPQKALTFSNTMLLSAISRLLVPVYDVSGAVSGICCTGSAAYGSGMLLGRRYEISQSKHSTTLGSPKAQVHIRFVPDN